MSQGICEGLSQYIYATVGNTRSPIRSFMFQTRSIRVSFMHYQVSNELYKLRSTICYLCSSQ